MCIRDRLETVPFPDKAALGAAVTQSDVVMNVSGAGMYPRLDETPADPAWLHPGQVAFDATYNPEETRFLREAREAGCRTFNGKRMLAYCGMLGYRLLTGKEPPKEEWLKRMDRMEAVSYTHLAADVQRNPGGKSGFRDHIFGSHRLSPPDDKGRVNPKIRRNCC